MEGDRERFGLDRLRPRARGKDSGGDNRRHRTERDGIPWGCCRPVSQKPDLPFVRRFDNALLQSGIVTGVLLFENCTKLSGITRCGY